MFYDALVVQLPATLPFDSYKNMQRELRRNFPEEVAVNLINMPELKIMGFFIGLGVKLMYIDKYYQPEYQNELFNPRMFKNFHVSSRDLKSIKLWYKFGAGFNLLNRYDVVEIIHLYMEVGNFSYQDLELIAQGAVLGWDFKTK